MTTLHTVTFPHHVEIDPGAGGHVSVSVTNTSKVIDSYQVQVFGLDASWVDVSPPRLSLFPGDTATVDITVSLPLDHPTAKRTISINVTSDDDPGAFNLSDVELFIAPSAQTAITLDPTMVTSGRSATFGIVVSNEGNAVTRATGFAVDPEELAEFVFDPPSVVVPPGRDQIIRVTARGGRAWFGQMKPRTFQFGVDSELVGQSDASVEPIQVETAGTFLQRPRIGQWMLSLLGLLTAALVFAYVLNNSFNNVVREASISEALLNEALNDEDDAGTVVSNNPSTLSGTLKTATGETLAGVQAELFPKNDTENPAATAVTDDKGSFTLSNLAAGIYKLRLNGSGLEPVWYPTGSVASEGADIPVGVGVTPDPDDPDAPGTLAPFAIGGLPVEVAGSVDAENPLDLAGATITLVTAGQLNAVAVVATVTVSPDGSFTLPNVPSPGEYTLQLTKPGFAPEERPVTIEPGESLGDLALSLRPGNGLLSGFILDNAGIELGGVTITATDGVTTVETVSLTEDNLGAFRLRNLPSPAQLTVTISKDGYIPETRAITLTAGQRIESFTSRLVRATGSISGRATVNNAPAQGLVVTLSGGDVQRTTSVASQGIGAGRYAFDQLPAPATYTLTFTGPNLAEQVRVLDLDPRGGREVRTNEDVSLTRTSGTVTGSVTGFDNRPVPGATVKLTDGLVERVFTAANDPAGAFEFADVAPGAYTLTAEREGTVPRVELVNLLPNSSGIDITLQLGRQAWLTGQLNGFDPTSTTEVRLFLPADFPRTPQAVVVPDATGSYRFNGLDATTYIVGVFATSLGTDALDSVAVETVAGEGTPAQDLATP